MNPIYISNVKIIRFYSTIYARTTAENLTLKQIMESIDKPISMLTKPTGYFDLRAVAGRSKKKFNMNKKC
jgi:hypothetical protein